MPSSFRYELDRLKSLEEEQEQLNSSLFALTAHFAQVQFRLKQIVDSPAEEKEVIDFIVELPEYVFCCPFWVSVLPDVEPGVH